MLIYDKIMRKIIVNAWKSFRFRMILFFTISSLLAIGIISYFTVYTLRSHFFQSAEQQLKTSSDYLNKEIDNLFTSVINIMEISGSSQTTRFLTSTTDQERYFSSRELLELFKSMRSTGQLPDYVVLAG